MGAKGEELTEKVYDFWFGKRDLRDEGYRQRSMWWQASKEIDFEIEAKFKKYVEAVLKGEKEGEGGKEEGEGEGEVEGGEGGVEGEMAKTPKGRVALVLLLDQFTRNIYRGDPRMFSGDTKALKHAKELVASGEDKSLSPPERLFVYTPYQHSENVEDAEQAIELCNSLAHDCPPSQMAQYASAVRYAVTHANIIRQFGRYPHRNILLSRTSTPEEEKFLKASASDSSMSFMSSVQKR